MALRVTFQSLGLQGITWQGVRAEGGAHGMAWLWVGSLPSREVCSGGSECAQTRSAWSEPFLILEPWGLARLAFGEQLDRFTDDT